MLATIAWDQTLLSLVLAVVAAFLAYRGAARVLRQQTARAELQLRRDALEQVLAMVDGAAGDYLRDETLDYPQREMVELERRTVQAQILFWRDLAMQRALQAMNAPGTHAPALVTLREAAARLDREAGGR
jgi:hypothetical protein